MRPIPKLGLHAVPSCEVFLQDVCVSEDSVVGSVGGGWRALRRALDAERVCVGAVCTGLSQRCLELARDYGNERRQFSRPVSSFQAISHMLAEMATETQASRLLAYHAAATMDSGADISVAASMAKSFAAETGTRSANRAMQIFGGYSYSTEYEIERFYREAKLYEIAGGSTQIQRNIIARGLGVQAR